MKIILIAINSVLRCSETDHMKQCTLCKQIKPLDDFYDDKRLSVYDAKRGKKMRKTSISGKQARCKACHMKVAHATRDKKKQAAATQRYQE